MNPLGNPLRALPETTLAETQSATDICDRSEPEMGVLPDPELTVQRPIPDVHPSSRLVTLFMAFEANGEKRKRARKRNASREK